MRMPPGSSGRKRVMRPHPSAGGSKKHAVSADQGCPPTQLAISALELHSIERK
ncbi:hypothetical protein TRAPUB_707 [Trametes pubescens]|uniref:Uncharacterized protein n=1 Tax=Trametes pubescens TaxID=154538 RepID=A0A1M2VLB6_TRAPU|nr:hypothetical protein TRAPUB_707 [Trametes pubescens]